MEIGWVVVGVVLLVATLSDGELVSPQEKFRVARSRQSVKLADKTFGILTGNDFWVIKFFAPWCGHCMRLEPQWKKFAKILDPNLGISVGEVNCVDQKGLESAFGIEGYPTILMYHDRKVWTYTGGRMADDLLAYFKENGPKSWLSQPPSLLIPEDSPFFELRTPFERELDLKSNVELPEIIDAAEIELAQIALPLRVSSLIALSETVKQGTWFVKVCSTFTFECQQIVPRWLDAISKVKERFGTEIQFVEVEASDDLINHFRIKMTPAFLSFRDGKMYHYNKELEDILSYLESDWAEDEPYVLPSVKIPSKTWGMPKVLIRLFAIVAGIVGIGYLVIALIAWSNKSKSL